MISNNIYTKAGLGWSRNKCSKASSFSGVETFCGINGCGFCFAAAVFTVTCSRAVGALVSFPYATGSRTGTVVIVGANVTDCRLEAPAKKLLGWQIVWRRRVREIIIRTIWVQFAVTEKMPDLVAESSLLSPLLSSVIRKVVSRCHHAFSKTFPDRCETKFPNC